MSLWTNKPDCICSKQWTQNFYRVPLTHNQIINGSEVTTFKTKHAKLPTHEARVNGTHFPYRLHEQNHRMTFPEIDIEKCVTDLMFYCAVKMFSRRTKLDGMISHSSSRTIKANRRVTDPGGLEPPTSPASPQEERARALCPFRAHGSRNARRLNESQVDLPPSSGSGSIFQKVPLEETVWKKLIIYLNQLVLILNWIDAFTLNYVFLTYEIEVVPLVY